MNLVEKLNLKNRNYWRNLLQWKWGKAALCPRCILFLQSSFRSTVNMLPKHKMLIKNTRLICILTLCQWTAWRKKKSNFLCGSADCSLKKVLKLIRTLQCDVRRGWPHGTPPPVPLSATWLQSPRACSSLLHYHFIQTEAPTLLLSPPLPHQCLWTCHVDFRHQSPNLELFVDLFFTLPLS